ncbi:HlyD family secretion protein [Carboxylicivirga sp. M1479]|uniref:HlyD family secretion protein n=1 Tax=Carboxylicivirga sp. M1479 TaxID=2594476 RepID=UPI001177B768|nr:HlyD family efflux transporter periplasmic adaptor subunit [Carboxylicivirga sp. M1479]TRX72452.1 HlyD family efflux transporter periplasmic adaptor subunit [Carboxylicivirga sp. M1479]
MKKIFPPEIIAQSTEKHFYEHNRKFTRIYVLSLLLIVALLISLPLISLEITTQSRGIIRTPYENNKIQGSLSGQVVLNNLREGDKVKVADTLVVLCNDHLLEQIRLEKKQLVENNAFIEDIVKLLSGIYKLNTKKYQHEATTFQAQMQELEVNKRILKREYDIAESLFSDKVMPELEYLQKKNKYELLLSQLDLTKRQVYNSWQAEKTRLEQENRKLKSSISKTQLECENYIVTAPISGTLSEVIGISEGSYITIGQVLAYISPDEQLIAECYINPKDIGYLTEGQTVRIQLDAFNYNQWGLIQGVVTTITDDVIIVNNQPVFKVRCSLPVNYLSLKSGHRGYLKKGMTLTSRFVLTNRTLYQLLFDKVDDWMNPKLVSNDKD